MPTIVNVTAAEQAQIRNAIAGMIARLGQIADPDLRECIRKKAQGNDEVINQSQQVDGHEFDLGFNEWRRIGPFVIWKSDDIHVSLKNHAGLPARALEDTLMHEWAHSCCWEEGGGKGVPQ
jgi:hypothetical protein